MNPDLADRLTRRTILIFVTAFVIVAWAGIVLAALAIFG
jgi:hypothetical protein